MEVTTPGVWRAEPTLQTVGITSSWPNVPTSFCLAAAVGVGAFFLWPPIAAEAYTRPSAPGLCPPATAAQAGILKYRLVPAAVPCGLLPFSLPSLWETSGHTFRHHSVWSLTLSSSFLPISLCTWGTAPLGLLVYEVSLQLCLSSYVFMQSFSL